MLNKKYLNIVISLVILICIFVFLNTQDIIQSFLSIPWHYALIVILGYMLGQVISSYKWYLILKSSGSQASFTKVFSSYFTGMFINCFGLGIVGGDLSRGLLVSEKGKKTSALATVVADRMQGLAVLALLGTLCAIFFETRIDRNFFLVLAVIEFVIIFLWVFGPNLILRMIPKDSKLYTKLEQASSAFPRDFKTLFLITLVSLCFHVLQIGLHGVMGMALGVSISWALLFATIPFVNILTSLPISWNGLGVREVAYIFFLTPFALSQEQAVVFGAIWLLAVTLNGLLGGLIALTSGSLALLKSKEETKSNE